MRSRCGINTLKYSIVQIIDESVGGIVNAECVKETYLLDTEDVYVGHLFLAISKYLTWDATK